MEPPENGTVLRVFSWFNFNNPWSFAPDITDRKLVTSSSEVEMHRKSSMSRITIESSETPKT